jgi:hypothetical protein
LRERMWEVQQLLEPVLLFTLLFVCKIIFYWICYYNQSSMSSCAILHLLQIDVFCLFLCLTSRYSPLGTGVSFFQGAKRCLKQVSIFIIYEQVRDCQCCLYCKCVYIFCFLFFLSSLVQVFVCSCFPIL